MSLFLCVTALMIGTVLATETDVSVGTDLSYLTIQSTDCLSCTVLTSLFEHDALVDDDTSSSPPSPPPLSWCCQAIARAWPSRLHECVALCDQLRLLRRLKFAHVECEMLAICRHNEQKRLAVLDRVRDERLRLAAALAKAQHREQIDASFDDLSPPSADHLLKNRAALPSSDASSSPPPPTPPPSPPAIDAAQLELLVKLEDMRKDIELEAVRVAEERIANEQRLAAELRAERERAEERERRERDAQRVRVADARASSVTSSERPPLTTTTWPYSSSPSLGAVMWSALSDCFWLPLLLLWFIVDYASDRVTTYYLSKAFESEHIVEQESAINRYSALFVAAQRSALAVASMRALGAACSGDEIADALFAFRWSAASAACLHTGDGCWLHFVVALAAVRCAHALMASVRTFMSYWGRQRVWQWLDSMVWLTDIEKPTNVLVFVLLLCWPARWKLTIALVTVYIVSSIVDALLSVALDLMTTRTMEDMMSLSWGHIAIMAHKVVACWIIFSHINSDGSDLGAFAFVITLMLLALTAAFARAVWKKLLPRRKFATD
jgi:hypothetical protein